MMKPVTIIVRFLLTGILGTILVAAAVPFMRVGLTSLAIRRSDTLFAQGLFGPALVQLLRVSVWQPWYPRLGLIVDTRIAACLNALDEAGLAAGFEEPAFLRRGEEPRTQSLQDRILLHPNRLANLVIDRWSDRYPWHERQPESVPARPPRIAHAPTATPYQSPPSASYAENSNLPVRPGRTDTQWAVVNKPEARYYATDGSFAGRLPAGTVMSISQVRPSDGGDVAVATIRQPTGALQDIAIRTGDIRIRPGALDRTTAQARQIVVQLAGIEAAIESRQRALEAEMEARNPHARQYREVRQRYAALWKQIEERQAAHDRSTGGERMRAANELRRLKLDDAQIRREFETARTAYQEWQDRHQNQVNESPDATLQRLIRQRQELEWQMQ